MEQNEDNNQINDYPNKLGTENNPFKIMLAGPTGVGKSSMTAIIFNNLSPKDTFRLTWTKGMKKNEIEYIGKLRMDLYDLGGQEQFIKDYNDKKEQVFSNVEILIFVIEAESIKRPGSKEKADVNYFENCIKNLHEFSPNAKVFVLISKMDCISVMRKKTIFEKRKRELIEKNTFGFKISFFGTSIWDDSLYKAWKVIISSVIMNIDKLKKGLKLLMEGCDVDEINLYDKKTFLNICSVSKNSENDEIKTDNNKENNSEIKDNILNEISNNDSTDIKDSKQERISKAMVKFKLSISNYQFTHQLNSFYFTSKKFSFFIYELTKYTIIMLVSYKPNINCKLLKLNIDLLKKEFENIMRQP